MMKTSKQGRDFIKRFEKFEAKAYRDIAGIWTIGYGHIGKHAFEGNTITQETAETLLIADLERFEKAVYGVFGSCIAQWEFDALVAFVYNVGEGALTSEKTRVNKRARLAKDTMKATKLKVARKRIEGLRPLAEAMQVWNKATIAGRLVVVRGLTRRRIEEAELLLYADYEWNNDGVVNGYVPPDDVEDD